MAIALLYREELKEYDFGPGHPFRGDRYEIFPRFLKERLSPDDHYKFIRRLGHRRGPAAHLPEGLHRIQQGVLQVGKPGPGLPRQQVPSVPQQRQSARGPAGKAGRGGPPGGRAGEKSLPPGPFRQVDMVVSVGGGLHHAKPAWGEGFCIYNDVAFAGKYLLEECGFERVLILDTDAHAGNGTAEYFYDDPRVLFIDIHQDPRTVYPGTGFIEQIGEKAGKGFTINIPMPVQAGDLSYRLAFAKIVLPVAAEFKPQVIVRNGGSDPHFADTLTDLGLYVASFRMIGEAVRGDGENVRRQSDRHDRVRIQ